MSIFIKSTNGKPVWQMMFLTLLEAKGPVFPPEKGMKGALSANGAPSSPLTASHVSAQWGTEGVIKLFSGNIF